MGSSGPLEVLEEALEGSEDDWLGSKFELCMPGENEALFIVQSNLQRDYQTIFTNSDPSSPLSAFLFRSNNASHEYFIYLLL
ncbi:hypothetical protein CFP56_040635 [Quercus suber]|uniref:Uncharacterized protein n=1 Tax=Quercus suber TaxID=58331 RepID=A0AAW0IYD4_QUESU